MVLIWPRQSDCRDRDTVTEWRSPQQPLQERRRQCQWCSRRAASWRRAGGDGVTLVLVTTKPPPPPPSGDSGQLRRRRCRCQRPATSRPTAGHSRPGPRARPVPTGPRDDGGEGWRVGEGGTPRERGMWVREGEEDIHQHTWRQPAKCSAFFGVKEDIYNYTIMIMPLQLQ